MHRVNGLLNRVGNSFQFLRATAGTAIARLSHRHSVCPSVRPSVCLSVTRVDQAKTVQARIIKSSSSALVSGSVTLFQKFHRGHPNRGPCDFEPIAGHISETVREGYN